MADIATDKNVHEEVKERLRSHYHSLNNEQKVHYEFIERHISAVRLLEQAIIWMDMSSKPFSTLPERWYLDAQKFLEDERK
jgi:ribosome-associated toxin RatA of RatAB toxin-antitoxin module